MNKPHGNADAIRQYFMLAVGNHMKQDACGIHVLVLEPVWMERTKFVYTHEKLCNIQDHGVSSSTSTQPISRMLGFC